MIEEGVLNWEKVLTVLIGIVIAASIYLVIHKRRKAKRKNIERQAELLKSNEQKRTNRK